MERLFCLFLFIFTVPFSAFPQGVTGALTINKGARSTNNQDKKVFLTIAARGAKYMMLSNNGSFIGAKWEPYTTSKPYWKLAGEDGRKTVYAQFKDARGNLSEVVSAQIILDRIPPIEPSIVINSGRKYTNRKDRLVRLELEAKDAFQMRVSNRIDFLGAGWIPYRKKIPAWRLTARTGYKEVFVQYRDRAGNVTEVQKASVTLDYIPPTQCKLEIENGAIYTNSRLVTLQLNAKGATEMIFKGGNGWREYKSVVSWELTEGDGEKEVAAKFRDEVGNQSVIVRDRIILDTQAPQNGMLVINEQDRFTKEPDNLHLKIFATGANEMLIANNQNFEGARWRPFSTAVTSWEVSEIDGEKNVYIKFRDKAGNESEVISDQITLDRTEPTNGKIDIDAPGIVYDSLARAKVIKNEAKVVNLKISAEGADYMMISNSHTFYGATWSRYKETYENWELDGDNDGTRAVFIKFRDKAGNVTLETSDKVIVDTQAPVDCKVSLKSGDPSLQNAYCIDPEGKLELRLFARGAYQMMISNRPDFKGSNWEAYATERAWQLEGEDGPKTVYVKYQDFVGNVSKIVSDSIELDRVAPTDCSIVLNKGAKATNNYDKVVLTKVKATDAVKMQVSNTEDFRGARWLGYSALNFDWKLAGNDGMKVVYVRFQDEAGNISKSYMDSIELDRKPPIEGSVLIDGGSLITNNTNKKVNLNIHAEDVMEMRISNNYFFEGAEWEPYSENKDWLLVGPDGLKTVFVQFRDELGNVSRIAQDKIGIDRKAPEGGQITINRGEPYCTDINKIVSLRMSVRDATEMIISNDPYFKDVNWQKYEPFIEKWTLEGDDGDKKVYAKFKDKAGNETEPVSASVKLDRQEPVGEKIVINAGAEYTNNLQQRVLLEIEAEGAKDMMIAHDKFFRSPARWEPYKVQRDWTLRGKDGIKQVWVKFRDEAGNESTPAKDDIRLDTEPPKPRSFTINSKQNSTDNRVVTLNIKALQAHQMMISDNGRFTDATWEAYAESKTWTLSGEPGLKRLFIKFKDDAENVSSHIFADIVLVGAE
ncbi:MAG: hypothetical protein ACPGJS_02755 [Flammeovirgaceae bacterium]